MYLSNRLEITYYLNNIFCHLNPVLSVEPSLNWNSVNEEFPIEIWD